MSSFARRWFVGTVLSLSGLAPLAAADTPLDDRPLPQQLAWVEFDVCLGRITAHSPRQFQDRRHSRGGATEPSSELYQVCAARGAVGVTYERRTPAGRLLLELVNGDDVRLTSEPAPGAAATVSYRQRPGAPVRLEVRHRGETTVREAGCLWRLWLAEPDLCETALAPHLALLRPEWRLGTQAQSLAEELLRSDVRDAAERLARWRSLVDQLDSDRFQERQAASQALRQEGVAVLTYLGGLELRSLSREQRTRISRLMPSDAALTADAPPRVAMWLAYDAGAWDALAARPDLDAGLRREALARQAIVLAAHGATAPELPAGVRVAEGEGGEQKR